MNLLCCCAVVAVVPSDDARKHGVMTLVEFTALVREYLTNMQRNSEREIERVIEEGLKASGCEYSSIWMISNAIVCFAYANKMFILKYARVHVCVCVCMCVRPIPVSGHSLQ